MALFLDASHIWQEQFTTWIFTHYYIDNLEKKKSSSGKETDLLDI